MEKSLGRKFGSADRKCYKRDEGRGRDRMKREVRVYIYIYILINFGRTGFDTR